MEMFSRTQCCKHTLAIEIQRAFAVELVVIDHGAPRKRD